MTAIAEYYAKVGFQVDKASMKQMDNYLKRVERRMAEMQTRMSAGFVPKQNVLNRQLRQSLEAASKNVVFRVNRFAFDATALRTEATTAFNRVSAAVPFQVSKFVVDRVRLQRALMLASRDFTVNMNPNVSGRGNGSRGYGGDRVQLDAMRHSQRMELERLRQQGSMARSAGFGAAAGTGMFGAHGGRLPGLIGGGYVGAMALRGIGSINTANQEVISTQLTTQAVTEAAGLGPEAGPKAFNWLQRLGNNLGFNYMDQAQDYNSFLANSLGAGQTLGGSQSIYKGFAEYQRAMGITPARQKLVMSALSQMMGKGVVSMEELRRQMSESMPGTMSVFAAAYQNMLASQGKGGGLTGQAALAALLEAVPTGSVRSNELLPFVAEEQQRRAAPKLDIARETSQAWQGRLDNQRTGWAMIASESGVEEGQRNFFRFFTQWMNENKQIPQKFGEMWKNISEQFAIAGGFGGLLKETLGGRDTIIKEWLGEERTQELINNFATLNNAVASAARFFGLFSDPSAPAPGVAPKRGEKGFGEKGFWQMNAEQFSSVVGMWSAVGRGDFTSTNGMPRHFMNLSSNFADYLTYNTPLKGPVLGMSTHVTNWMKNPMLDTSEPYGFQMGGDYREPARDAGAIVGGMRYERPNAATLANGAGLSFAQGEAINVGGITIHATSSEPEAIKEAVEEALRQGLPPKSR